MENINEEMLNKIIYNKYFDDNNPEYRLGVRDGIRLVMDKKIRSILEKTLEKSISNIQIEEIIISSIYDAIFTIFIKEIGQKF